MTAAAARSKPAPARPGEAPALDIVAAMNSKLLFADWFKGSSWDNWRTVLKAAFALPMTDAEHAFFRTVAGRDPPERQVRELWCVVGRGGGKDSVASLVVAYTAALFDRRDRLRPGERALCQLLACDRDQARIVLGYTRSYFESIAPLRRMVRREVAHGFELDNGVDVMIATNSYRAVRGRTLLLTIMDECAFWRDERSATPDEETYRAVAPGLARLPGSLLIGISTPHAKRGLLHRKFNEHYGQAGDVLVIKAPSSTFNPTLDQAVIDQALAEDAFAGRAEWLAEFRDDVSNWAPRELIEAAVDHGVLVRPPQSRARYVAFCDPSGGQGDSFTCAVAHREGDIVVLDCLIEIVPPFNTDAAVAHIAQTLKSYGCTRVVGDGYGKEWVVQTFARHSIRYDNSEHDCSALYANALPLFSSGRAKLLDNKRLVHQFAGLERTVLPAGRDKITHPKGAHDDLANSVAGAIVLAGEARRPLHISRACVERFARPNVPVFFHNPRPFGM
jgi:hypothetical protein